MRKLNYFAAFIIIGIAGTLWHFIYDVTNNGFLGLIAPVNESTWEHFKILFYPTLIYSVIEYFRLEKRPENYISASVIGLFAGLLSIVSLFYTYKGILGFDVTFIDILIFFISLLIMLLVKAFIIRNGLFPSLFSKIVSLALIVLMIILFSVWSFSPPSLGIFTPPTVSTMIFW